MRKSSPNQRLALHGGPPTRSRPWLDNFTTGPAEERAAVRAIRSGHLSLFEGSHTPDPPFSFRGGPEVQRLESLWRDYYGCAHAVSVNSATSGLYAAIGALGLGYGDEVIVSPYTMTACALAPLIYGAIPVFADVEPETGCLDPKSIERLAGPRTKAVIVVHQFGFPADMGAIMRIAREKGLKVIEDCAQAHGAKLNGRFVGTFGDIGVFSLNVNKTIQTGEGGVCITNHKELEYRLALIRNHGEAVVGPAGYKNIVNIAGFNYRLTEVHAAMAQEQLAKLDRLNERRLRLVERLTRGLRGLDFLRLPNDRPGARATYYIYSLRFVPEIAGYLRAAFASALCAEGIPFYEGYTKPLYLQPLYQTRKLFKAGYPFQAPANKKCRMIYAPGTCPTAERLHFKELLVNEHVRPPHVAADIQDIIRAVHKVAAGLGISSSHQRRNIV